MSDDPKHPVGMPDGLNAGDRAMLLAISRRQRDSTPLSLDQERLLDSWVAGALASKDADRAIELTKHNKNAAEHILELRLIAGVNESPDVPAALSARILGSFEMAASVRRREAADVDSPDALMGSSARDARGSRSTRFGWGSPFNLRWPTFGAWQWSGLGAAAAAIALIAVLGFQTWQMGLKSNQSFQIALVTIEDRGMLLEGSGYRTRGRRQVTPTNSHFRDVEISTALLRRAINGASTDRGTLEYSELMSYLRAKDESVHRQTRIVIDSALADVVPENVPEHATTQIRVYNLDNPEASAIRDKIRGLPVDTHAILLTLK